MPFPPINLSSPGRELFGKKKANGAPSPVALAGQSGRETGGSDREKPRVSWTSAHLRSLGRKAQHDKQKDPTRAADAGQETRAKCSWLTVPKPRRSSDVVRRSGSADSAAAGPTHGGEEEGEREIRFTLSLTPEAIHVIQKRNLEKQLMARQQRCCAPADPRRRRVAPASAKKAHGAPRGCAPVAGAEGAEQDIAAIVKVSLLNDRHKYDDVEYEEEDADVDETVVRKCKEWLKGVESAAALGRTERPSALPRLKSC